MGTEIQLRGVNWQKSKATLILAVSKNCHFCVESAPSFRRILASASSSGVDAIALVPGSADDTIRQHVERLGLNIAKVRSMDGVGIEVTPTVLLVDQHGKIRSTWIGATSPEVEREIIGVLSK